MEKILIIDDNPVNRKLVSKWLSIYGDCEIAKDGSEAIQEYHRGIQSGKPYTLFILDLNMGNMSGEEVLVHIRTYEKAFGINKYLPIIMCSGEKKSKIVMGLFKKGCQHYLVKPIDKQKLNEALSELKLKPSKLD